MASGTGAAPGGMAGNLSQSKPPLDAAKEKPLTSAEIDRQATHQVGNNPANKDTAASRLKDKQDTTRQQARQRQKLLEPQFDQLNDLMAKLQTGVLQGQQAATTGGAQLGSLDKEVTDLETLLGGLQKQAMA